MDSKQQVTHTHTANPKKGYTAKIPTRIHLSNKELFRSYKKCKTSETRASFVASFVNFLMEDFVDVVDMANPDGSDFIYVLDFLNECNKRFRIFATKCNFTRYKVNKEEFMEAIKAKSEPIYNTYYQIHGR